VTAPSPVYFDLRRAEEAEDREENGAALLPGDRELITALDGYRQNDWATYWSEQDARQLADWLAAQCRIHVEGGTGPECDDCFIEQDAKMQRSEDL
jgi:hypothetical protein